MFLHNIFSLVCVDSSNMVKYDAKSFPSTQKEHEKRDNMAQTDRMTKKMTMKTLFSITEIKLSYDLKPSTESIIKCYTICHLQIGFH